MIKLQISATHDLAARIADLFRRYQIDFGRMTQLSEAEEEQAAEPFRREISALIAAYGREAVIEAALLLPARPPTLN
jgi:hypothetical protein